jgi:hypothetical protein
MPPDEPMIHDLAQRLFRAVLVGALHCTGAVPCVG